MEHSADATVLPEPEQPEQPQQLPEIEGQTEPSTEPPTEAPIEQVQHLPEQNSGSAHVRFDPDSHTPYGPGSLAPRLDGSTPGGYPVKGNTDTMLFHTAASRWFSRIRADVWFESEEAAVAAGFTRWDRRGTAAHTLRD